MEELEEVTAIVKEKYAAWKAKTADMTTGYEYESSYASMMQELEREIFALSTGDVPKDKNRKKNSTRDSGS
ncbi:hypothetical protein [Parapedobacter sp. 2B3]|uniref:hypothetical protein n=1 Tax=Parapedobacter sp. 2B3 TaxID=3342381 RepID=UPI0035B5C553